MDKSYINHFHIEIEFTKQCKQNLWEEMRLPHKECPIQMYVFK